MHSLTPSEAKLLDLVLAHPRRVFTPQELLRHLRGPGYEDAHGALRQVILGLRRKIEPDPSSPTYLVTAPGGATPSSRAGATPGAVAQPRQRPPGDALSTPPWGSLHPHGPPTDRWAPGGPEWTS